ncbi:hypothetical protein Leryth_010255 [Lithospermum erythrorhizon]|nr:hypothetical protein Leryth_010255 [Lithospermum erythrorhizon]
MAKGGKKLTKLKSVLKKMQSFKIGRANDSPIVVAASEHPCSDGDEFPEAMQEVYVGRSRRRYLVSKNVVNHPLFRELVERTGDSDEDSITIGCEVVLFEHMIWMLQHVDSQPESLDELVEFYAY